MTEATLSAKVTADIADFNKKFGELNRTIDNVAKGPSSTAAATSSAADSIEQSTGRWKTAFAAAGAAVAAGALIAANAIGDWTRAAAAAAEKTEQISQQTGIAAATLESWSVALNRVGLDSEVFGQAFKTLSKDIEEARGVADFSKTKFAEMGLTLEELGSTETVIRALADRLSGMTDPAARAQLAIDLLGKGGLKMLPILMQGSAGLDALAQKSQQFGLVLDESARTSLLKYDDSLDDLGKAWEGLKTKVAVAAAPILLKGVELAQSSIAMSGKIIDAIVAMVNRIDQAFQRLGAIFARVRQGTEEVTGYFKALYDKVVGHSYIPDMVDEIGQHMEKLDANLTAPARRAAINVENVFRGIQFTVDDVLQDLQERSSYTAGAMIQSLSGAFAGAIQGTTNWAQVGQQILNQFLTNAIGMVLTWTTTWLAGEAMRTAATITANTTIAASTAATMSAMKAVVTLAMTGLKSIALSVARTAVGVVATVISAITPVLVAVSTVIAVVMKTIGLMLIKLGTAMQSVPIIGNILGAIVMAMGGASIALGAALPGVVAGLMGGLAGAVGALGSAIPAFATGGAVFGPTLALVGENASRSNPEYIGHANQLGLGGIRQQTIIVQIDGDELMRYVANKLIPHLRLKGAPI
jgi:hypothetical protein